MHRTIQPKSFSRISRSFSFSRVSRNIEVVPTQLSTAPPPSPNAPAVFGRRKRSIGRVTLQPREAPAAVVELDDRIRALESVAEVAEEPVVEGATYTEQELATFYQDILANPFEEENNALRVNEESVRKTRKAEDAAIVEALYERFDVDNVASTSERPYLSIVARLQSIISRLEAAERMANPNSDGASMEMQSFPISILTSRECQALVRVAMRRKDSRTAEEILALMKRTGLRVPEEAITDILRNYANAGDLFAADSLLKRYVSGSPSETQRHLHVHAHLQATPSTIMPSSALDVLHSYETKGVPAPMHTYTTVITSLFTRPSSLARSQGWDLFSHMRYVAHPDPDVPLYTQMIRACASPLSASLGSEPEKALDLWTEMTVDHQLTPTVAAYNAIILACARDGSKRFVAEAFRLARQMLDSHRNAQGISAYRPDRKTFAALLEGAKRIGDLGRVRWILAEMTRNQEGLEALNAPTNAEVDEEIMLHVFNAYGAYKPPFVRAATKIVKEDAATTAAPSQEDTLSESSPEASTTTDVILDESRPSFAHIPPQTHEELIQEVNFLFDSIKEAQSLPRTELNHSETIAPHKFRNVQLTPRLATAYLSVLYAHSSLHKCREAFWSIFSDLRLQPPLRAYLEAIERCASTKKNKDGGRERLLALKFADELWKEWFVIERAGKYQGTTVDARTIERVNAAMIRVLTLNDELDRALDIVRAFADRYRPQAVRTPPPKPFMRSTRTVLSASKPLVRMTGATDVPDDFVPPLMTFKDVEVLHHRLVAYSRTKDIGYLTWLCKAYEWALRVRRDEAHKYIPPKEEKAWAVVPAMP
ncbi:hypothetical protein BKA70DRAFT_825447 [Coprinopsis sp. MPI-PUGE-AT-0042]|nr:hypothetical protein BKA70DRAFT_825447 [Coprinopsis sp. MPI-PUGE-AT-0042]